MQWQGEFTQLPQQPVLDFSGQGFRTGHVNLLWQRAIRVSKVQLVPKLKIAAILIARDRWRLERRRQLSEKATGCIGQTCWLPLQ